MECIYYGGGSRKHLYVPYKTFWSGKTRYRCARPCGTCTISVEEFADWEEEHKERERLVREYFENM